MANLHQAEANVKIKQGALDKAKADLEHCTITSPIDGVVISRNVDVGQTVAASLQAPVIFQIANDLTKMQIDANVAEADVGVLEVGQDVDFTVDAFPMRTFRAREFWKEAAARKLKGEARISWVLEKLGWDSRTGE